MYCMGIDIGGTKCAISIGNIDKQDNNISIINRKQVKTEFTPEETFLKLSEFIYQNIKKYNIKVGGISCGGPLDSNSGIILTPPNLVGWHSFNIVDYCLNMYGLTTRLKNDANACALAEWKYGAGKGTNNMVFMTFGTGLGSGLILNGKLYEGSNGNAGEIGHIRLSEDGPYGYGKNGSFEGFCSGNGISKLAEIMGKKMEQTPSIVLKYGGYSKLTAKILSEEATKNDLFSKSVYNKCGEMLGKGLSIIIDLINPELIVIGGVYMRSCDLLIEEMNKQIIQESLNENQKVCKIVSAKLNENIGDYAALSVAEELL